MKRQLSSRKKGSVLMIALLTITILTLLCATSLYITSQNANATTQATSWEQAMAGAEAAVDHAMNALNTGSWTTAGPNGEQWYTISGSLPGPSSSATPPPWPFGQPSPSPTVTATAKPSSGKYNYYKSSISLQGEASNTVIWWVTVDDGSVAPTPSPSPGLVNGGLQAYRIRATAVVGAPGPARASNNKLDNDLRQISLAYNRLNAYDTSNVAMTRYAARRIELVATPVVPSGTGAGLNLATGLSMSGSAYVDSFNSNNGSRAWSLSYRDSSNPQVVGIVNNTWGSDLRNTNVYGGVTYSGTTVKDMTNVKGSISTPYPYGTPSPAPTPPTGVTYTTYAGGGSNPPASTFTAGNGGSTNYVKVNGNLTVSSSGQPLTLAAHDSSGDQLVIWVTGDLTISGSGYVSQDTSIKVTWYVGGNIIFQGGYLNGNPGGSSSSNPPGSPAGWAGNLMIYGYGGSGTQFKDQGSALFTGQVYAPNYTMTISGSGVVTGALTGNTLDLSGIFHYDESLSGGSSTGSSYAFSRWFEDNSDPARGIRY